MAKSKQHQAVNNAHPDLSKLRGGIAVITGSASGIGYALAERAVAEHMQVVIVDIEESAIERAVAQLKPAADQVGVKVVGVQTDVSLEREITDLTGTITDEFGDLPISLLACNAGVGAGGGVLTARNSDWDFTLGVNLMGVVYCLRHFVPGMINQEAPGAVVTTSSQDGLCCANGVYGVSKHACVALTEALYNESAPHISSHVLCPNVVATNIVRSERNRPDRVGGNQEMRDRVAQSDNVVAAGFQKHGMPPSRCADFVFEAIQTGVFYVMAEAEDDPGYVRSEVEARMDAILNGTTPFRPRSELISKVFRMPRSQ